ncbi:MAG: 1-phosphofructokinase family hexose kinase [Candidatus Pseudobacter hemicellulosilyticus]|uniref:1-phosphofructokinase family hexose kinase n=1 Tax=Candidatus Pseudobacter hemicellulosilyticus TaxID=3121375 RepID=A0AAJ5WVE0_9BACT|nr:MAG: 1-phosphofructokinase family hexose kinase [Pseudobacter sp.]
MIVTITMNPSVDKSTSVDKLVPEKKMRCAELITEAGGGGINISKALKELGGDSLAIFPSGGLNGKALEGYLSEKGIRFQTIPIERETRENIVVRENHSNQQFRFVMPGPEMGQQEVDACLDMVRRLDPAPSIIVASGSLPPGMPANFFGLLADLAKEIGARYIVDTSGEPLLLAAQEGVYLLKPNMSELGKLSGHDYIEAGDVGKAALEVIRKGECEVMVVSMGPAGALLVTRDGHHQIPAPVVKKQSTVGAGDSMVAGMIWQLSQGKPLKEVVQFGVACGTAATMNPGTTLFKKADVERLFRWIQEAGQ